MSLENSSPAESINPLNHFALNGRSEELGKLAQQQVPILAGLAVRGQSGVWYAKPNSGKTLAALKLLVLDIQSERLVGEDCYYVAADDSAAGVLEKLTFLEPYGVHVLAPGLRHFQAKNLPALMQQSIENGTAQRRFIIADTIKKFTNLMDKNESSKFAGRVRQFTLHGGSFLGLAHTNKRTGPDGKPIFAGTSDLVDDSDFIFTMQQVTSVIAGKKMIQADRLKSRGSVVERALLSYSAGSDLPYATLLQSFEPLSPEDQARLGAEVELARDAEVIAAIQDAIRDGITGKMAIARSVSKDLRIGRQSVECIIEGYDGEDPAKHRWTHTRGHRGVHTFELLPGTPGGPPPPEMPVF
jgi:hypothetical protein